jgi:hypothetical protein
LGQESLPLARVILVEDVRCPGPPADAGTAAELDPDARVRRDVPDPVGAVPALGYQPEGIPVQAIAHRRAPGLPGTPPGRLQQGVAGGGRPRSHASRTIGLTTRFSTAVPYSTIRPAIFSASLLAAAPEVRVSRTWTGLAGTGRMALIDHRDAAWPGCACSPTRRCGARTTT